MGKNLPKTPRRKKKHFYIPRISIDFDKVDAFLLKGGDGEMIASEFGIHPDTLYRQTFEIYGVNWSTYAAQKRAKGNLRVHCKMYDKAMEGNAQLLIHLAEHRLGQHKRIEQKVETNQVIVQKKILKLPDNGRR